MLGIFYQAFNFVFCMYLLFIIFFAVFTLSFQRNLSKIQVFGLFLILLIIAVPFLHRSKKHLPFQICLSFELASFPSSITHPKLPLALPQHDALHPDFLLHHHPLSSPPPPLATSTSGTSSGSSCFLFTRLRLLTPFIRLLFFLCLYIMTVTLIF